MMRDLLRMAWAWMMMAPEARTEIANVAAAFCVDYPSPARGRVARAAVWWRRAIRWVAAVKVLARKGALFCGLRRRFN